MFLNSPRLCLVLAQGHIRRTRLWGRLFFFWALDLLVTEISQLCDCSSSMDSSVLNWRWPYTTPVVVRGGATKDAKSHLSLSPTVTGFSAEDRTWGLSGRRREKLKATCYISQQSQLLLVVALERIPEKWKSKKVQTRGENGRPRSLIWSLVGSWQRRLEHVFRSLWNQPFACQRGVV